MLCYVDWIVGHRNELFACCWFRPWYRCMLVNGTSLVDKVWIDVVPQFDRNGLRLTPRTRIDWQEQPKDLDVWDTRIWRMVTSSLKQGLPLLPSMFTVWRRCMSNGSSRHRNPSWTIILYRETSDNYTSIIKIHDWDFRTSSTKATKAERLNMPLYNVEHSYPLSLQQKTALAERITKLHATAFSTPSMFVQVRGDSPVWKRLRILIE